MLFNTIRTHATYDRLGSCAIGTAAVGRSASAAANCAHGRIRKRWDEALSQTVGFKHQLAKPFAPQALATSIARTCEAKSLPR